MPAKNKRLRVIAGPNGSGKSTIIERIRQEYNCGPFVNADRIESLLRTNNVLFLTQYDGLKVQDQSWTEFLNGPGKSWVTKASEEGKNVNLLFADNAFTVKPGELPGLYDAAIAADFIRHQLLENDGTFTIETVLSDIRKIDFLELARQKGFKVYLYFVCTVDSAINVARVEQRVREGGHNVPEEKIIQRYTRSLQLLPQLIPLMHRAYLFDNSSADSETKLIAEIDEKGSLYLHEEQVPWWISEWVIELLFS